MRCLLYGLILSVCGCVGGELAGGADASRGGGQGGQTGGGQGGEAGECSPGDRRCIGENKTQICSVDGQWSVPRNCVNGRCQDGICTRSCENSCTPGDLRCVPSGLQTCERGATDCGTWGPPQPCPDGQACQQNTCQPTRCETQCEAGMRRCVGASAYSECTQMGGCTSWSPAQVCPNGESCSGGQCRGQNEACRDSCVEGTTTCVDRRNLQRCERQANGCLDFSPPEACSAGESCDPQMGCVDVCGPPQCQLVQQRCFQGGIQTCVEDFDGCPVWGAIFACPDGQSCEGLQCVDTCNPECVAGARRCANGGTVDVCEVINGCERWGNVERCPQGTQCQGDGECGATCRNGDTESRQCGGCGLETRSCANGEWGAWGACAQEGECTPGTERACGDCGRQVCNDTCGWGPCQGEGVCTAGDSEDCGECGTRLCNDQCQWNDCGNTSNRWRHCRDCGWEFCCPDGDWCGRCAPNFPERCGEFGMCVEGGVCVFEV